MTVENKKHEFDFEKVFNPDDYLYFYEDIIPEEQTQKEIDFLVKELGFDYVGKVLDLACGHGRHANPLAELGFDVTGVDITKGFLEIAEKEAKEKRLNIKYVQGDMREITYVNEFERGLLLFTAFGYFEDKENFKVLQNIVKALKPGGLFCFDIPNRDVFLKNFLPFIVREKGSDLMIDRNTFDVITGCIRCRRIEIRDGNRKDKNFFIRLYNFTEIKDLLERAGLKIEKVFGDWDSSPLTNDSSKMIIISKTEKGE